MANIVRQSEAQVRRYWTEDGIPDLYLGVGFVIYAALLWWEAHTNNAWIKGTSATFLILFVALGRILIEKIKERLTYPRTGYVKYIWPSRKDALKSMAIGLGVAAVLAFLILYQLRAGGKSEGLKTIELLTPLLFAAILGMVAYQQRNLRFGGYAILAAVYGWLGVWVAQRVADMATRNALLNGVSILAPLGITMLIGGTIVLARHLRTHPLSQEGEA